MNTPKSSKMGSTKDSPANECDLIEVINKLQDKLTLTGHPLKISLPQIVVVGCQSAGKSSVLESIVGREFLPRGCGVVTRRPTVIQLEPCEEEYAVFLHREAQKIYDFQEVKREIENETLRDPGPHGFSSIPINLKIYSPRVLKLTLVDLPGLIKNVVEDQLEESIDAIYKMVMQYIEQPNSIILAVTPAHQDIATSDALNIAKAVDPKRKRTIGVLTKLDLMDAGTDARDVLQNKTLYLERGYVGVINRSQKDINEGKDILSSWQHEKEYFANHTSYCDMSDKMGCQYLQKILHQQLKAHIKQSLPAVRKELTQKLRTMKKELKKFDYLTGSAAENNSVQFYMIKLTQRFIDHLCTNIYGLSEYTPTKQLSHGFLINYKLYTGIQAIQLPSIPDKEELLIIISNLHGIRNIVSVPALALEIACGQLFHQYLEPLECFIENIIEILNSAIEESIVLLEDYHNLKDVVLSKLNEVIENATEETKDSLKKHVEAEIYFMNIYHEDFDGSKFERDEYKLSPVRIWKNYRQEIQNSVETVNSPSIADCSHSILEKLKKNDDAQANVKFLADMVQDYLVIQQKQMGDTAIKHVAYFLVKRVIDFVKSELVPSILDSQNLKAVLEEFEKDYAKRDAILNVCNLLEEAISAVQMF